MIIAQEVYYVTTGAYRHRKSLTIYYGVKPNGAVEMLTALYPEENNSPLRPQGNIAYLPSIRVTATDFKEFEKKRKIS